MSLEATRKYWLLLPENQRVACDSADKWHWIKEREKLLRGRVYDVFLTCDILISRSMKTSLKLHTGFLKRLWLSDREGNLSDGDVRAIVARNHLLLDINLYAPNLTDKALIAILKHCRSVVFVGIHGLPSTNGCIKGYFVDFMNMRENQREWPLLNELRLDNQPIEEARMRSVTEKRHGLEIRQSIALTPAVAEALSNAGVNIPGAEHIATKWRRGHVVGIDWVALVRREQARLDDLKQLAIQLQNEMLQRLRQKIHELEQELEENGTPLDQFRRERDIARLLVNSAHSDTEETGSEETGSEETGSEETGPEESCSEAEGSGDDGLGDLDTRRLGSYEEGDSEADELEEEEDILEEEESEADELEEETGEEHSNEEDCSPEETGGEGEEDDDERYQNEEEARPSIKAERIAQIADQEILNTESRYWAPVERNTGATIKQESRPSVARSLPRKSASISADEDNDMRIASGTHIQDERQPSDRSEADSKDELCNGVKSESRIHAQDAARLGNDIERSNVVKTYYPRTPIPPLEFPGSVTLRFSSPQDWERRWHRAQRRTGIRMVIFEPSFAVTVADINLLAWSPAAFSSSILAIRVGNGALLDDQSITNLAANMAQLTQVQIDLAPSIGDQSIMSLIEFCPAIEYIETCGDELTRRSGGVTLRNLDAILIANENKAQRLRNLVLVDQLVEDKSVEACEKLRVNLKIIRGHQTREEIMPGSRA